MEDAKKYDDEVLEDGLGEETDDIDLPDAEPDEEVKESGVFTLTEPILYEGQPLKSIPYDFNNVKPVQYIQICKTVSKKENIPIPELNTNVQFTVFCRAAEIPVSVLKTVKKLQDFTAMCAIARDFLLGKQEDEEDTL